MMSSSGSVMRERTRFDSCCVGSESCIAETLSETLHSTIYVSFCNLRHMNYQAYAWCPVDIVPHSERSIVSYSDSGLNRSLASLDLRRRKKGGLYAGGVQSV